MSLSGDPVDESRVGRAVSIGIAAWNAEANIGAILTALACQRVEGIVISEIIVHSDRSTDGTVAVARRYADSRFRIVEAPERRGFAAAVAAIIEMFTGDALVLLNDDIRIEDDRFIEKLGAPVFEGEADFVGANSQPLPPRTFVERASVSVFRVWERIRESMPEKNNIFTCDGAAMCLSAHFAQSVALPKDLGRAGNVDAFLYLTCAAEGFRYLHVPGAVVYCRYPASLGDYLERNSRNQSQRLLLRLQFGGSIVSGAFRVRPLLYWKSIAKEVLHNPAGAAFIFVAGFYVRRRAKSLARNASPTWDSLKSSKRLD